MTAKYYTGVGSRETPADVLALMRLIAAKLAATGWTLRSGAAGGADTAFESGVKDDRLKEIYIPWNGFSDRHERYAGVVAPLEYGDQLTKDAFETAANIHPAWEKCSVGARKLHARNVFQVYGGDLATPSKFLICWTPNGAVAGGTATAIILATQAGIPVFNLAKPEDRTRLEKFVQPELPIPTPEPKVEYDHPGSRYPDEDDVEDDIVTEQALRLHDAEFGEIPI